MGRIQEPPHKKAEERKEEWNLLLLHNKTENLNTVAELLTNDIREAANLYAPPHNISPRSKPWWPEDLTKERRHMNTILRELQVERHQDILNKYTERRTTFFHNVKKARKTTGTSFW